MDIIQASFCFFFMLPSEQDAPVEVVGHSETRVTVYSSQPWLMLYGVTLIWKTHVFPIMLLTRCGTSVMFASWNINV